MEPFDTIEKLINERGSATIIGHHLSFVKEQHITLEKKVSDLERHIGNLEAKLEAVTLDRNEKQIELQRLKDEYAEEVRIHYGIEFRRGKRTGSVWQPFCPKCHMPVLGSNHVGGGPYVYCSGRCDWAGPGMTRTLALMVDDFARQNP